MASDEHAGRADNSGDQANGGALPPLGQRFLWADSPLKVNRVIMGLAGLCALLFLADFVVHRHAVAPGEGFPGYHAIVGFVAFTCIVLAAKQLRRLIRRDESFYAPYGVDAEQYPSQGTDVQNYTGATAGDVPADGDR